jgi:hypothetical protein
MSNPAIPPKQPETPAQSPSAADSRMLLDIHLAEYSGLVNRVTYWISIQYVSYSVAAVLLTLIVSAWGGSKIRNVTIVWGGLLMFQLLAWAWVYSASEIHNTAVYLEGRLRPRISELVNGSSFWGWEPYLAGLRTKGFNRYEWTLGILVLFLGAIPTSIWLVCKETPNLRDWRSYAGWLVANLYVTSMIVLRVRELSKLQDELIKITSIE